MRETYVRRWANSEREQRVTELGVTLPEPLDVAALCAVARCHFHVSLKERALILDGGTVRDRPGSWG